ncbi:MAG: isochorismatase family protein [Acidobacteria bacterium]|nr:isochorismatase family protein [Acidobacteriota bacterium]MBI3422810.1 isochorismatase family protein [Acidobacteriota bacterium]
MIFFDIDTQHDFIDAAGALAVPDAEVIKPQLERLLRAAGAHHLTTISSRCAHAPGDAEFAIFPPHCLEGTPGAERVYAALPQLPRTEIAVDAWPDSSAALAASRHYVVKKNVFDLFANAWLNALRARGVFAKQDCVVFGVATDYCVRAAALGLAQAGARVWLVEDAVRGVASETTAQTMAEMRAAGVGMTTTDEVLQRLAAAI